MSLFKTLSTTTWQVRFELQNRLQDRGSLKLRPRAIQLLDAAHTICYIRIALSTEMHTAVSTDEHDQARMQYENRVDPPSLRSHVLRSRSHDM
jgi:hypothetical protein